MQVFTVSSLAAIVLVTILSVLVVNGTAEAQNCGGGGRGGYNNGGFNNNRGYNNRGYGGGYNNRGVNRGGYGGGYGNGFGK